MNSIFFALISYFSFGVGDMFGVMASRKIGGFSLAFWNSIFALILFSFYFPFAGADFGKLTLDILFLMILVSILENIAFVFFYEGLRVGNASVVAPIAGSSVTLFVLLAFLIFKDKISQQQIFGIVTTLVGIVLLSFFSI